MKRALALLGLLACGRIATTTELELGTTQSKLSEASERLTGADLPEKQLTFTFDDGPSATTSALSTYLAAHEIHATFFVDGSCVATTTLPAPHCPTPLSGAAVVLAQISSDGHLLGNHTTTGRDLVTEVAPADLVRELTETDALIAPYLAWNEKLFRAPHGSWIGSGTDADAVYDTLKTTALDAYTGPISWNIDADCTALGATACGDAYLREIHARGAGIVRFDDSALTLDVVEYIVPILQAGGYGFAAPSASPAVAALQKTCDATCQSCDGPGSKACTQCGDGLRLVDGACTSCLVCPPGTFTTAACSAENETRCLACSDNTYQSATGATTCISCGDCSDGKICTRDTCDPVRGCRHEPIGGCVDDASVALPDAGGSTRGTGSPIDEENNMAVDDSSDGGCAAAPRSAPTRNTRNTLFAVSLVGFACVLRRRGWKRPLSL